MDSEAVLSGLQAERNDSQTRHTHKAEFYMK